MKRRALVLILALALASCGEGPQEDAAPEGKDKTSPPRRIVSVAPSATEILFALGVGDRVVGVSSACDYPPEVKELEKVSQLGTPSVEKLLELRAELVVSTPLRDPTMARHIRTLDMQLEIMDQHTLADLYASILRLGQITGVSAAAEKLVATMKQKERQVAQRYARIKTSERPRVFVELWYDPLISAGRNSFISDMIEKAGGRNIAAVYEKDWIKVSSEFVIEQNPQIIVLSYMGLKGYGKKDVVRRIGWADVDAVRNSRIVDDIYPDYFCRPGPRVMKGLEMLADRFHPTEEKP